MGALGLGEEDAASEIVQAVRVQFDACSCRAAGRQVSLMRPVKH